MTRHQEEIIPAFFTMTFRYIFDIKQHFANFSSGCCQKIYSGISAKLSLEAL
jgi:hypothetical protein